MRLAQIRTTIWRKLGLRIINLVIALVTCCFALEVGENGFGLIPPIGKAFNPAAGVWTMEDDINPSIDVSAIKGLDYPVKISFNSDGVPTVQASTDHDLFLAMGYLHAKFRLFEMDAMRRQGEGLLSQIVGNSALRSDELEDELGLQKTATLEFSSMSAKDPARQALLAYSQGVNDVITDDIKHNKLPYMFNLLGYQPKLWTPVDSLVIQGVMTQTMDFTDTPLDYELLANTLGYNQTMKWFPVIPVDNQSPYDTGPFTDNVHQKNDSTKYVSDTTQLSQMGAFMSAAGELTQFNHLGANSNNWAIDGSKSASGQAMLAGDPHLELTLPSTWYQITASSDDLNVSGVGIPGVPTVLIGHNDNIAWSLTNVQSQATFFYQETTSASRPGEYLWDNKWHRFTYKTYTIPIKGQRSKTFTVKSTVHGPLITDHGLTMSVEWLGAMTSPDIPVMLQIMKANNYTQFRQSLQSWNVPAQNFVYADRKGNIGMISAGYYPIINGGKPWLPMSGTGIYDIIGRIPFSEIPQVYNPPNHFVFSANQRVVGANYPFYIGTSLDFFDNGYRADEIKNYLQNTNDITDADFEQLQNSVKDYLSSLILPKLLTVLQTQHLSGDYLESYSLLSHWNGDMSASSPAAALWWTFWTKYIEDTFEPWWKEYNVPVKVDRNLLVSPALAPLDEDLEKWTLSDPTNPAFNLPNGQKRVSSTVMTQAFRETVASLEQAYGTDPLKWNWGRVHHLEIPSLSQIPVLGYGPVGIGGDSWTVDASYGVSTSTLGPSWRMIIDWGGVKESVYPGGQSEDPLSPWYENGISKWLDGQYSAMQ